MENKPNINDFINLKVRIIDSLKAQGHKENWMYPTLRNLNFHKLCFNL